MNTNVIIKTVLAADALVLISAVIGRYGETLAEFLRADVLLGFGVVATLVALITLEYGRRVTTGTRTQVATSQTHETALVPFARPQTGERIAA